MIPLAIVGAGGHASDVLAAIEARNATGRQFEVVGLYADGPFLGHRFADRGVELIGGLQDLPRSEEVAVVIAVGYPRDRERVGHQLGKVRLCPAIVHPDASIGETAVLSGGVVALAGARISPGVHLGENTHISYNAFVGHDSELGAYCSVMPLAAVAGNCQVGGRTLIGAGAVVLERLRIGEGAVLPAGTVVDRDVEPRSTFRPVAR